MVILSSIFSVVEKIVVARARALGEQVENNLAFGNADAAQRLTKMEDLSFLSVTMLS
ncbi:hypothetical protein [Telmatospirillum sp.]|uniref:hypothetical protein n=1 Tax=Telmatospirillum sp. TaxID=2079197 RepID=UPI00283B412A|nr:hypothetical protein [Telmatospirillum sp.]MDR3438046.1 hypothetical protein [Telmatospirillum sp.]